MIRALTDRIRPAGTDADLGPRLGVLTEFTAARTVRWGGLLFAAMILIQRISVPGLPVPMLLPVLLAWVLLALRSGVLEIDQRRLRFWCAAVAVTGLGMLTQTVAHPRPVVSVTSWALIHVVWLSAVFRFTDRRRSTYEALLRAVVGACSALAVGCIVFMGIQLLGVPYRDVFQDVVPQVLLERGWTISSPVEFGSPIYRANAWVGLEPSMTSYQIAIGVLASILVRSRLWVMALLVLGMFATVAGSGFLLAAIGVTTLSLFRGRRRLLRMVGPLVVGLILLLSTPFGETLINRTGEAGAESSSTSLRAIQPYSELWPTWSTEPATAYLGAGAGASQRIVDVSVFQGLVPLPAKIFYDYGMVFGMVLAAFLIFCYLDGLSAVFAVAFLTNLWTIQPGSNIPVFVIPVLLLVTWFAPRTGPRIEDDIGPLPVPRARSRA
jgi:hypothetical protein